jgi:diaminopimelate epimerase
MKFTKMHGIGNDYVYVDCFAQKIPSDPSALAIKIADRHFGVGGDGLILICPSERADARMRMFNADGSESEMCGNGIRCVAKFVHDHGIAKKPTLKIETGNGVLSLDLEVANGKAERVRVNMGEPILEASKIPAQLEGVAADSRIVDHPLEPILKPSSRYVISKSTSSSVSPQVAAILNRTAYPGFELGEWMPGLDPRITCVSMGNPHVTLYCNNVKAVPLQSVGPVLETLPEFPRRINVHFVQVHSPTEVTMRTWERGSGITLACGTGASAVCVAGVLTGRTGRKILAHLPGGDLELEWNENDNHVYMTGAATEVFSGEWPD